MTYYKTWQDALVEYIRAHGHEYNDVYILFAEFEQQLQRNVKGAYYMQRGKSQ